MDQIYTVKQCAQKLGITRQGLYKKLYNDKSGGFIQDHVFVINGKKFIDKELLDFFMCEKQIAQKEQTDPMTDEISKISVQLSDANKKKLLKAAQQILELQKYD